MSILGGKVAAICKEVESNIIVREKSVTSVDTPIDVLCKQTELIIV